jgi:hypothetical protein
MLAPTTDHQIKKLKRLFRIIMFEHFGPLNNCLQVSLFKHTYKKCEMQAFAFIVGVPRAA